MVLLRKRERNEIFQRLASSGVDVDGYELADPSGRIAGSVGVQFQVAIRHAATSSEFAFDLLVPGEDPWRLYATVGGAFWARDSAKSWQELVERQLAPWAREVQYETETPDLWNRLERVPEILVGPQSTIVIAGFEPPQLAEIASTIAAWPRRSRAASALTSRSSRWPPSNKLWTRSGRRAVGSAPRTGSWWPTARCSAS